MKKQIIYATLIVILCFILNLALNFFTRPKVVTVPLPSIPELQEILGGNQSADLIKDRLAAAKDEFSFFRSFVPLYYRIAHEAASTDFPLNTYKYKTYYGVICGDLHPNNLGPIFNDFGDPEITLNDFDDAGEGHYILDFLRYLVALRYLESDVSLETIIATYQNGLNGVPHSLSEATIAITGKSKIKGTKLKKDLVEDKSFTNFKNSKVATHLSESEQQEAIVALSNHFMYPIKIFDAYQTYKIHGGAGGLLRINLLIGPNADNLQWIELKELRADVKLDEYKNQVDLLLGNNFKNTFQLIHYQNRVFYLKHHSEGEQTFDIHKVKAKDFESIILDQVYLIGEIHRRSMESSNVNVAHYGKLLSIIPTTDWINSVSYIHETFVGFFKQTH